MPDDAMPRTTPTRTTPTKKTPTKKTPTKTTPTKKASTSKSATSKSATSKPAGKTAAPSSIAGATKIGTKPELAAELNRLLLTAERRAGGRGALKRAALARRIGVSVSSLYAYLDGTTLPPAATFDRLLDALGVDGAERGRLATARDALDVRRRLDRPQPAAGVDIGPHELPPDVFGFTGRAEQLAELDRVLAEGDRSTVLIWAVTGTGGVGKTALTVHWAHRVRDRFPDGQLYLDLRGYDPQRPVEPGEALGTFLRSLGVPAADIPRDLPDRVARYRTLLDRRRMLVVLDNAASADQVRHLLPGAPSCLALITSRDSLTGLVATHGGRRIGLDRLPPAEALALLRTLIGDPLVDADPDLAAALVERCAGLPLALRLAADLVGLRPEPTLGQLVAELDEHRLDMLDAGGDERAALRSVFSWSYRSLGAGAARAYRLLGLHPGRDFDAQALAALAGVKLPAARRLLAELTMAHLAEPSGDGRCHLHDLLRDYAAELAAADPEPEREAAFRRLADHYASCASSAMDVLFPHDRGRPDVGQPATVAVHLNRATAMAWLEAERHNMLAVALRADRYTLLYSRMLWRYLHTCAHYGDALNLHSRALQVARRVGDRGAQAYALVAHGTTEQKLGRNTPAIMQFEQAIALAREIGDGVAETAAINALGIGYELQSRYPQAIEQHQYALALARQTGDRTGEGNALNNLSTAYAGAGQLDQATAYLRQALDLAVELGDRCGESYALGNLGLVSMRCGRYDQAVDYLRQCLLISGELRDRAAECVAMCELGVAYGHLDRPAEATDCLNAALQISREIGARTLEATALNRLGEAALGGGDPQRSLGFHQQALSHAVAVGERAKQAAAHRGLGRANRALGRRDRARAHWEQSLAIYRELGLPDADEVNDELSSLRGRALRPAGRTDGSTGR